MAESKTLQEKSFKSSVSKETALNTILFIFLLGAIVHFIGENIGKFIYNTSASLPQKVFWLNELDKTPERGEFIVFYFKGSEYYPRDYRMIKQVVCLPGDMLEVDNRKRYYCNGVYIGTARDTDSKGKPVENFVWKGKIPEGNYFVMGVHPLSYDSRYWGFVEQKDIIGVAKPMF